MSTNDEAIAPQQVGECRVDELRDVVVELRRRAERRALDAGQLRERRLRGTPVIRDCVERSIVEPSAQRRVLAGIETETGRLFRAAAQVLLGQPLQQRGERRIGRFSSSLRPGSPGSPACIRQREADRRPQQRATVEACRSGRS
jgi:hypothetical protein